MNILKYFIPLTVIISGCTTIPSVNFKGETIQATRDYHEGVGYKCDFSLHAKIPLRSAKMKGLATSYPLQCERKKAGVICPEVDVREFYFTEGSDIIKYEYNYNLSSCMM